MVEGISPSEMVDIPLLYIFVVRDLLVRILRRLYVLGWLVLKPFEVGRSRLPLVPRKSLGGRDIHMNDLIELLTIAGLASWLLLQGH